MRQESRHNNEDDGLTDFRRARGRTWRAAAPYLAAAALCWVAGGYSQYVLMKTYTLQSPDGPGSSTLLRQSVYQSLSQVLFFAGCGLFLIALLIGVLRQHERWRRDLDLSLDDATDEADFDGLVVSDGAGTQPAETPAYARSVWADEPPDTTGGR